MQRAQLGDTDLFVAPVAFGTSPLGGNFGRPVDEPARLLREVVDLGINLIDTAAYYGDAEQRLGTALRGMRDQVVLASKAGRYQGEIFDHTPSRIRQSIDRSLHLLGTDYLDIFCLHDIEYVPLGPILEDSYAELLALRELGKCRWIGMTGFPIKTMATAIGSVQLDVALTYAHATLLDDSATTILVPLARAYGTGLINAAAVALGLLTSGCTKLRGGHPAPDAIIKAVNEMKTLCTDLGVDIAFLANQYSIQRSGCATTVIGTTRVENVRSAVQAATTPIDEPILDAVLALRPPIDARTWRVGLPENN
jgi:L-galactose dehydrogenase